MKLTGKIVQEMRQVESVFRRLSFEGRSEDIGNGNTVCFEPIKTTEGKSARKRLVLVRGGKKCALLEAEDDLAVLKAAVDGVGRLYEEASELAKKRKEEEEALASLSAVTSKIVADASESGLLKKAERRKKNAESESAEKPAANGGKKKKAAPVKEPV